MTLLALLTAACAGLGAEGGPLAGPSPSHPPEQEPPPEAGEPFVPKTSVQGDQAIMDLTFPDGTMATISYPAALDLAGMGVQPDVDLAWEDRWVGALVFTHGPPDHRLLAGAGPLTVHRIDGRPVEEWNAQPQDGQHQRTGRWLVFRLSAWTVHVPLNARTEADEVVDHVRPYETGDGFVAVTVGAPAELPEGYGEAGGPQLSLGDSDASPDYVRPSPDGLHIDLAPSKCGGYTQQVEGSYGSTCLDGAFFVNGTDFSDTQTTQDRLRQAIEGMRVLELQPAG
jgi:hypothetical protein